MLSSVRGARQRSGGYLSPRLRACYSLTLERRLGGRSFGAMARILLAEDDDQLRAFLSRGLRRAGHAVDAVADGEAALVQAHDADYDLLVADVVMPGIDGIELARRVSAR